MVPHDRGLDGTSPLPLYHQAEDRLREGIASGKYKEGDCIPSEFALAEEYGVSQGTVRRAVLNLTQKGILYRKQGKGTFVVFPISSPGRYRNHRFVDAFDTEFVAVNLALINLDVIPAADHVAKALQLRRGTRVIRLERMGKIGAHGLMHSFSYLPKEFYKNLEKFGPEEFLRNTLWKIQEIMYGYRIKKREEFISAVAADPSISKKMDVSPGTPLLRIEVKVSSSDGHIIEYRVNHCNTGGLRFYNVQGGI